MNMQLQSTDNNITQLQACKAVEEVSALTTEKNKLKQNNGRVHKKSTLPKRRKNISLKRFELRLPFQALLPILDRKVAHHQFLLP